MRSMADWASTTLILVGLPLLGIGSAFAQQDHTEQLLRKAAAKLAAMPLQGMQDCGVVVENMNQESISGGLKERNLQREVSAKLSTIGLKTGDAVATSNPYIYVNVLV